jgi:LPXTG-motif cell wall-anchored protein
VGEKVESASGIASYVFFGLLILAAVVLTVRRRRREKRQLEGPADPG